MSPPLQIPSYEGDHTFSLKNVGDVTIHHGADPKETLDVITMILPAENAFSVPLHYHPKSTEWIRVLEGEVTGMIDGERKVMKAGDDWLEVPAGTKHSFNKKGGSDGVRVILCERAGPDPYAKKKFFEDFLGSGQERGFVDAMATFYRDGDSFPALPGGPYTDIIGRGLVYLVGGFAHLTGLSEPGKYWRCSLKDV